MQTTTQDRAAIFQACLSPRPGPEVRALLAGSPDPLGTAQAIIEMIIVGHTSFLGTDWDYQASTLKKRPEDLRSNPWMKSAKPADIKSVINQCLAAGVDIDLCFEGSPLLCTAISSGRMELMDFILSKGADINLTDLALQNQEGLRDGINPPLIAAVAHFLNTEDTNPLDKLLSLGANLNVQDCFGATSLFYLGYQGQFQIGEMLIAQGANPCAVDNNGNTMLHDFIANTDVDPDPEVVRWMVKKGVDPYQGNKEGDTVFDLVNQYFDPGMQENTTRALLAIVSEHQAEMIGETTENVSAKKSGPRL